MDKTRKNTLKIVIDSAERIPQFIDILRFSATVLKLPATDVHSIYRDENDRCFYIKFNDEPTFTEFTGRLEEVYPLSLSDGRMIFATLEVASRVFRYVRIFSLPPEVEDKEIAAALSKYGTIRQHVREKYPASYGYSVYCGVRGVYMEIAKEMPANLHIGHFKARLYYEGLKNKCFFCKQEGHIKANCPKVQRTPDIIEVDDNDGDISDPENQNSSNNSGNRGGKSYSKVVANKNAPSTSGISAKNIASAAANNKIISNLSKPNLTKLSNNHDWPAKLEDIRDISPITPLRNDGRPGIKTISIQRKTDEAVTTPTHEEDGNMVTDNSENQPEDTSMQKPMPMPNERQSRSKTRSSANLLDELEKRSRSRSNVKGNSKGKGKNSGSKGGDGKTTFD